MKRFKNKVLSIIVLSIILSFIMLMFCFINNVEASTAPVGQAWVTADYSYGSGSGITIIAVHEKEYLIISDYSGGNYSNGYLTYFAKIPLNSNGGTYTISSGGASNFNNIFTDGYSIRGSVDVSENSDEHLGVPRGAYYASPYTEYSAYGVDEFLNMDNTIPMYDTLINPRYLFGYRISAGYAYFGGNRGAISNYPISSGSNGEIANFRQIDKTTLIGVQHIYNSDGDHKDSTLYRGNLSPYGKTSLYTSRSYIGSVAARSDSNYIYFVTNNKDLRRINLDGTGLVQLQTNSQNGYFKLLRQIPKHNFLIYSKNDTHYSEDKIYRSNINGGQEVLLIDPGTETYQYFYRNIKLISDDFIYYVKDGKTFRQHVLNTGVNEQLFNFEVNKVYTVDDETFFYTHSNSTYNNIIYKYSLNDPPELTLNTPLNSTENSNYYVKEEGLSTINVSGSVKDVDNDTVTVSATLGGVTKTVSIANTATAKTFNFTFDVITDNLTDGTHTLTVTATDPKGATAPNRTRTIIIKGRVRHDDFVLVDSSLYYQLLYEDEENDPKYQEQFRYVHNPNYFKNPMGVISDSNTWRNGLYNKLALPGHYKITYRAKDNPKNLTSFDEFRLWSRESLSEINLYIHRKPIAIFKATANTSGTISVTDFDKSYDPDHQGETNNGIIARQWQWRNVNSPTWTTGVNPPTYLPANQDYIIALRVRDKDGIDGIGVWGDWTEVNLSTGPLAPLNALFTLNPNIVSHSASKTITTTNLSTGPITKYEWIIRKGGVQQGSIISTSIPTSAQLKTYGIGKFTLQLRVGDTTRWSEPYALDYEVINNPPIASFDSPDVVYRDDILRKDNTSTKLINTTSADLDGDTIYYKWEIQAPIGVIYTINGKDPNFKIQDIIIANYIPPINAISKNWEIKLIASENNNFTGFKSEYTKELEVINNIPEAKINGLTSVKQYTTHNYTSNDTDADTGDNPLTIFRWKHIKPDGSYEIYTTENITLTFNQHGNHTIEHYTIDSIGDKSNTATFTIDVEENLAPQMILDKVNGDINVKNRNTPPKVVSNFPILEWRYNDPENDPQEKYSFDFYYYDPDGTDEDDLFINTITSDDNSGNIKNGDFAQFKIPDNSFDRFRPIKVVGRAYSKNKWSDISNAIYFIINDAPVGDFILNKNPPNYNRNENITITGQGSDPNIPSGDAIRFKYFIRLESTIDWGTSIYTTEEMNNETNNIHSFTHNIDILTKDEKQDIYEIRQITTDKLGMTSEVIKTFTINNQKPEVNIIDPSSTDKDNPTLLSDVDLNPIIEWEYSDLDGDIQQKFRVYIFQGNTDDIVVDSGEKSSSNKSWQSPTALIEDILYSVIVEVYDGHEWSISDRKYFKVFSLKVSGYLMPNPALAGDQILFFITTEGYADKIEIVVPSDLIAMDERVSMGYQAVSYPSIFFNVDNSIMKKEDILDYIAWVSTDATLGKEGNRLRLPYIFTVIAHKGSVTRQIELELDIQGSVLDLIKPGIKLKGN